MNPDIIADKRPIETAPKDGTLIYVGDDENWVYLMRWDENFRNALILGVTGFWVNPDKTLSWSDRYDGYGPKWWAPYEGGTA